MDDWKIKKLKSKRVIAEAMEKIGPLVRKLYNYNWKPEEMETRKERSLAINDMAKDVTKYAKENDLEVYLADVTGEWAISPLRAKQIISDLDKEIEIAEKEAEIAEKEAKIAEHHIFRYQPPWFIEYMRKLDISIRRINELINKIVDYATEDKTPDEINQFLTDINPLKESWDVRDAICHFITGQDTGCKECLNLRNKFYCDHTNQYKLHSEVQKWFIKFGSDNMQYSILERLKNAVKK